MTNVIFLVIDALRADKIYSENKSSYTPNFDSLLQKGIYFNQSISCSDQTGTSLASIFTSKFPCNTNLNGFTFKSNEKLLLSEFQKMNYETYSFVPDIDFFKKLVSQFTKNIFYNFEDKKFWKKLNEGLGSEIISKIPNSKNPWFYFIHVMDIRPPFDVPKDFDLEKFGKTKYDRLVSSIDSWLGEFIQNIDLQNTIIVLTSDHGEYIPATDKFVNKTSNLQKVISKTTKSKPFLEKLGLKTVMNIRFAYQTYQKEKLKYELTPLQLRSLNSRAGLDLFDELIRVPLLFVGNDLPKNQIISELVRHVDIFPTLFTLLKIESPSNLDGVDLSPLWKNEKFDKLVAYLEVGINAAQLIDEKKEISPKVIGLRTTTHKYYRMRHDAKKYIHVFDLKNDPNEENNLSEKNPELIINLEKQLQSLLNTKIKKSDLSEDEIKKARDLLFKLGYVGDA